MPGPPPRQHKHERRYTPGTHTFIPTRRISNDDYGGQNDIRGPCGPLPTGDQTRVRRVTGAHATACSTAVDCVVNTTLRNLLQEKRYRKNCI